VKDILHRSATYRRYLFGVSGRLPAAASALAFDVFISSRNRLLADCTRRSRGEASIESLRRQRETVVVVVVVVAE